MAGASRKRNLFHPELLFSYTISTLLFHPSQHWYLVSSNLGHLINTYIVHGTSVFTVRLQFNCKPVSSKAF